MKKNKERGGNILVLVYYSFLGLVSLFAATQLTFFPKHCFPADYGIHILLAIFCWILFIMCISAGGTAIQRIKGG